VTLRPASLARNLATKSAGYVVSLLLAVVMFPVMFHHLGPARYGVWMLIAEFTIYYTYLDLGICSAVIYYAANHVAQSKTSDLNRTVSTAFWSVTGIGCLLSLLGFAAARFFPAAFRLTGTEALEASRTMAIVTLAAGISLPLEAIAATLNGCRRQDVINVIDIAVFAASSIASLVCVAGGGGLLALSFIQLTAKVLELAWAYAALRRIVPEISLAPRLWSRPCLRQLTGFGVQSMFINLASLASSRTDLLVVGIFAGVRMVPFYGIPRNLMEYGISGIRSLTSPFCAHLTHLQAARRAEETTALFLQGARISGAAAFLLTAYVAAFGHSFLRLWQGPAFVSGPVRNRADLVLIILAVAFLPRLLHCISIQFLYATRRLSFMVGLHCLEAILRITLSLALVARWGLTGVAVANLIPILLLQGIAVPVYLCRTYLFPPGKYLADSIVRPFAVGLSAYLLSIILTTFVYPATWSIFLAEAAIALATGVLFAAVIASSAAERRALWSRIAS
jgi:O-antigen/teichoic acid export membrane protein